MDRAGIWSMCRCRVEDTDSGRDGRRCWTTGRDQKKRGRSLPAATATPKGHTDLRRPLARRSRAHLPDLKSSADPPAAASTAARRRRRKSIATSDEPENSRKRASDQTGAQANAIAQGPMLALRTDRRLATRIDPSMATAGGPAINEPPERRQRAEPKPNRRRSNSACGKRHGRNGEGLFLNARSSDPLAGGNRRSRFRRFAPCRRPDDRYGGGNGLAALEDRTARPASAEIPKIYQPQARPRPFDAGQRIGASAASELAVERAIDWLTRHQDDDGRWDAGIARYEDGTPVKGDDDFTAHCPPGETCFGECAYWEADTALTGLALLTYLGAGYTHRRRAIRRNVRQRARFPAEPAESATATCAAAAGSSACTAMRWRRWRLCEAYALTGDDRLRDPVERAVAFMVSAERPTGWPGATPPGHRPATRAFWAGS